MNGTPCHDIDPNCQLCPFSQPSASCGTLIASTTGPPVYFCNAQGVACTEGRVNVVNVSWSGLVLSQLPSGLGQLLNLQELGKFAMASTSAQSLRCAGTDPSARGMPTAAATYQQQQLHAEAG